MAASQSQDSASKAAIPLELLRVQGAVMKRFFTHFSLRSQGTAATGYRRDVAYAAIRQLLGGLSTQQVQWLTPTTDRCYETVTKMKGQTPRSVDLGDGAQGHWIGSPHANFVMLYCHGGGFYGSATLGHIRYLYTLQKELTKRGHDISIFALTYTLTPTAQHPTQLKQAASALRHLLEEEHRDPSNILLGGDSAGGNLTAALIMHLSRPHPDVPPVRGLTRPLHAALLISPWVSYRLDWPSVAEYAEADYLGPRALTRACAAYSAEHDVYSEPETCPAEWWTEVVRGNKLARVMIWAGGREVLLDGIRSFAGKVEAGFAAAGRAGNDDDGKRLDRFRFVVSPDQAHEEMIIDEVFFNVLLGTPRVGATEILDWLSAVLSS